MVKRLQRLQNPKFSFDMVEVFRRICSWEKNPFYIPNLTLISYCRPGEELVMMINGKNCDRLMCSSPGTRDYLFTPEEPARKGRRCFHDYCRVRGAPVLEPQGLNQIYEETS